MRERKAVTRVERGVPKLSILENLVTERLFYLALGYPERIRIIQGQVSVIQEQFRGY